MKKQSIAASILVVGLLGSSIASAGMMGGRGGMGMMGMMGANNANAVNSATTVRTASNGSMGMMGNMRMGAGAQSINSSNVRATTTNNGFRSMRMGR